MPSAAPDHTTTSTVARRQPSSPTIATGVYVPAMARKIVEWSSLRHRARAFGDQWPRWYIADTPNMASRPSR